MQWSVYEFVIERVRSNFDSNYQVTILNSWCGMGKIMTLGG